MEIKKLKLKELVHSCEELREYINKEKPDWIIPIYSGGLELCEIIWGENEFPKNLIKSVSIRHKENKIMDKIIKFLPEYITDFLRQIDSIRPKSNKRDVELPDFLDELRGKVLIIDDAIDTGITIKIIKKRIKTGNIRVAVINNIKGAHKIDFSIYNNCLIKFPWNSDYKYK